MFLKVLWSFLHQLYPHWFLQSECMGTYLPSTGTLVWGPDVGLGLLAPGISLLNFYPPHRCGTSPFFIYAPATCLDQCGFFNSVVVRLPFNWISECSEWCFFYNLVVILMWLCKELSCVYLCCHLDREFAFSVSMIRKTNRRAQLVKRTW